MGGHPLHFQGEAEEVAKNASQLISTPRWYPWVDSIRANSLAGMELPQLPIHLAGHNGQVGVGDWGGASPMFMGACCSGLGQGGRGEGSREGCDWFGQGR